MEFCHVLTLVFALWGAYVIVAVENELEVDPNGYIVFCPCMGRFGNQVIYSPRGRRIRALVLNHWVSDGPVPRHPGLRQRT